MSFILSVDVCSLRLDFESFTTAGPTKTDDSVACIDSFQVTAVSCEISIFIQKFVKWILRKIVQNYPNLCCLLYTSFMYVFSQILCEITISEKDFFVFPHCFLYRLTIWRKKLSIENYGILLPHCFRYFPSNQHFTLKLIWRKKCQFKITKSYCHTVFANFRQINILLWNWFDEKNVNWKLMNFTATLFSQISVKSTFYLEIDLTKKMSIRNYGIYMYFHMPRCFRKFPSNQRYSLKLI